METKELDCAPKHGPCNFSEKSEGKKLELQTRFYQVKCVTVLISASETQVM
jgi:hypothetical protein